MSGKRRRKGKNKAVEHAQVSNRVSELLDGELNDEELATLIEGAKRLSQPDEAEVQPVKRRKKTKKIQQANEGKKSSTAKRIAGPTQQTNDNRRGSGARRGNRRGGGSIIMGRGSGKQRQTRIEPMNTQEERPNLFIERGFGDMHRNDSKIDRKLAGNNQLSPRRPDTQLEEAT